MLERSLAVNLSIPVLSIPVLLVSACLFLVSGVLAQPDVEEELKLEAVKEFRKFFRQNRDTAQRVEAVMTLEGNESVPAGRELVGLLDHKEKEIRKAAMQVISTYKEAKTFQGLIDELPEMKEQDRRGLLIEVLGRAGIKAALPVLREIALNDKRVDSFVRLQIAWAIGRMKDLKSIQVLGKFLADKDPMVRIAAADTVGKLRLKELGDDLVPLLKDKAWQVRTAGVKAVGLVRVEAAIDPLIAIMRKGGRLSTETADALYLITLRDYGANPDQWQKSIDQLRGFGWKMPTDEQVVKAKAARKRNEEYYGKKEGKTTFAKITTTSTRVLFIIDISGSMEDHVVEKEKFDAGYKNYQKLTIVKTELANTIEALGRNTLFNIVAFATDLKLWKKGLVPSNIVNRSSAMNWIRRLQALGGSEAAGMAAVGLSSDLTKGKTNTLKALMYPFNIDPSKEQTKVFTGGSSKVVIKNKLDTVFFLSDGRPSTGKLVDTDEILKEVARVNKFYRIVIHAIAIGQFQKTFLRSLAMQNGGEFVDLGY